MQLQGCETPTSITPRVRWQMQHAVQLGVSPSLWKFCTSPGKCTEIAKRQVALMFCVLTIIFKQYWFWNVDVKCDLLFQIGGGGTVFYRVDSLSSNVWRSYLNSYFSPLSLLFTFQLDLFITKIKTNFLLGLADVHKSLNGIVSNYSICMWNQII